jgi:hypothetical protein
MKSKSKIKTLIFQNWGTFFGVTMVCCGFENYNDVLKYLKKNKYNDWHRALDAKRKGDIKELNKLNHFSNWVIEEHKKGKITPINYSMLYLIDWKQDLKHYKILAHELVHAVQFCMKDFLDMDKETEAVAYQHSFLFEEIGNELNKIYK